jgi:hypothetical protein
VSVQSCFDEVRAIAEDGDPDRIAEIERIIDRFAGEIQRSSFDAAMYLRELRGLLEAGAGSTASGELLEQATQHVDKLLAKVAKGNGR